MVTRKYKITCSHRTKAVVFITDGHSMAPGHILATLIPLHFEENQATTQLSDLFENTTQDEHIINHLLSKIDINPAACGKFEIIPVTTAII